MGQFADGIRELKAALAIDPSNADDWSNLGVMQARSGDTAAARRDFERALALNPALTAARSNLDKLHATH